MIAALNTFSFLFIDLICYWHKPSFVSFNFSLWDIQQR